MREFLDVNEEVRNALAARGPIVALETTILSHGMPFPQNLATAREVEALVRARGAVPATIAVFEGRICVGLSDAQLERLAQARDILKLSRADLAYAVATRRNGATTVAATMICAHLAGIAIFATGGIGGVHRGAEHTFDVSTDLDELARTPVAVVCAGAKALLDLPKTLEVLETRGVPVYGFGTAEFPAFWSRSSGLALDHRLGGAAEAARCIATQRALGLTNGVIIANPIPVAAEIPMAQMRMFIETAIAECAGAGVTGKKVTPWLLDRIFAHSGGRSLAANIALVKNNASVAADIAVEFAQLPLK